MSDNVKVPRGVVEQGIQHLVDYHKLLVCSGVCSLQATQDPAEKALIMDGVLTTCRDIQQTIARLQSKSEVTVAEARRVAHALTGCREYVMLLAGGSMPNVHLAKEPAKSNIILTDG